MALVVVTLSTFQTSFFLASFRSISLSFIFEQSAKKNVDEASSRVGAQSRIEPKNVVAFIPEFESDRHVVKAVGRAVNFYKNSHFKKWRASNSYN
jgi:cysteine sulfinate desulfinase/cysteine desulfurase-like protein